MTGKAGEIPIRVLVNMPSQYGGKPSGVALVTFSLLEALLKNDAFDYVLRSPWTREQLPDTLRNSRLEVLTIKRPGALIVDVLLQRLTMPFIARRLRTPVVLNMDPFGASAGGRVRLTVIHDLYFQVIARQIGPRAVFTNGIILSLITGGSKTIIAISDATLNDVLRFYPTTRGKVVRIHNDATPMPVEAAAAVPRALAGDYVLVVGNATSNKNFGVVAEAMKTVLASGGKPISLVHVGDDPAETISGVLGPELASTHLTRLKNLSPAELAALYRDALCLCVPSLYEGFCLPVIEAQSMGCPVICSDASVLPEVAGDSALYFKPDDPAGAAAAILRIAKEPGLRASLVEKGRANRARFSWARSAAAYENEIRKALGRPS